MSAGQSADGLVDDCLKNRGCQIFDRRTLVDQRLDIGFGKYAAARRDRIDHGIVLSGFVESVAVCVQKDRHLIDERAGPACAGAVHPLFDRGSEIGDLCVFSAQLDDHIGLRDQFLHCQRAGDDLLLELRADLIGQR